ncbi:MAG: hypothetical protein ACI9R8_001408 [Candidatus Paceibacteria bacterium]|jgi:hypothetical protein
MGIVTHVGSRHVNSLSCYAAVLACPGLSVKIVKIDTGLELKQEPGLL